MAKKLSHLFFFILCISYSFAQAFQNEWIDYNKTYYKFKIGPFGYDAVSTPIEKGVVRISEVSLAAAGLAIIPAEQFQLWKDGNEIPIFVSKSSGLLSSSDYIEFWGEIANGTTDKQLYSDTSYQLSDHWSLESDSAAYFLTVNPEGNNKRLRAVDNIIQTQLTPEKNFIYTVGRYYRNELSQEIATDSIRINIDTYPFYFKFFGKQKIIRPTTIITRNLVSEGYLRNVERSDNNPHGFLIEKWKILDNHDLKVENRER